MRKLLIALSFAAALVMTTGCGFTSYLTAGGVVNQTNVVLSQNNFRVIGEAEGVAEATYILGIGGLSPKALKDNALAEMAENAHLKGSQALVNISVHESVSDWAGLYIKRVFTAKCQIVEFIPEGMNPAFRHRNQRPGGRPEIVAEPQRAEDGEMIHLDCAE
ncbi:MAG: hypothetical protein KBT44_03800 [Bacteroidales bacterium]|nr:hypothetical protein [Candidatus Equibacterium intestinale]